MTTPISDPWDLRASVIALIEEWEDAGTEARQRAGESPASFDEVEDDTLAGVYMEAAGRLRTLIGVGPRTTGDEPQEPEPVRKEFVVTVHRYSTISVDAVDEDEARTLVMTGDYDRENEEVGDTWLDGVEEADTWKAH